MKTFDLQGIEVRADYRAVFDFISEPANLPRWTQAFESAGDGAAVLRTPAGSARIHLRVLTAIEQGTIDWLMVFPDGTVAKALSRLVELKKGLCLYTFTLLAPPVPLEMLEGTMLQQSKTLNEELKALGQILEGAKHRA